MSFLAVVFIVLMILALFGGGYTIYSRQTDYRAVGGGYILLWICVAILGYLMFHGSASTTRGL